ncbi:MAG: serine/threonine protein kinase, partial [Deltaproteobacteria bacterium]|nr:serine/threonine protein kinase [Deltaproteobacteria bacterium]
MPEIPANLGRYQVLGKIAKGGMAEVYQAKALGIAGFERILAVKRILPHMAQQPRFIRSFIDEARIAVSLNHRNIVQVVDFGKSDGELFLAMELIDGVDLRTALRQSEAMGISMPLEVKLHILADVASGLDYAHAKTDDEDRNLGIVHCDISPQNIMLSIDGFVKILDFGVARAGFTSAPDGKRLRGKPRYMSPEQTRGEAPTSATDVFALGIVSWELFTGFRLFDGKDLKDILRKVRHQRAPDLGEVAPKVPAAVAQTVARALTKKPEDRCTASELATVFARSARDHASSTMDKALSSWLRTLFPRPELDPTETEAQVPIPTPMTTLDEATEITTRPTANQDLAPPAHSLLEERRVVVLAAHIDGGTEASQADLRRSLGLLAFKHGAVIDESGDLTAIFGLAVAAEDDVAAAMHLAPDAVELARETGP